jgi:hypothetical protein
MKTNTAKKVAPKEITFKGIQSIAEDKREKVGVIPGDLYIWLKEKAGNNPANVIIRPVQGLDISKGFPFERTMFLKDGNPNYERRALVMWALANSGKAEYTLADCQADHKKIKSPAYGVKGLIDALNGGQSPSAKTTWGRNYVELVVKKK